MADYNVSHTVSWDDLNKASLIFGKTFDTNYKLRSLSVGSSRTGSASDGSDYVGQPNTNEWDQILDKSSDYIKHWSNIYSWGQSPNIITCNGEKMVIVSHLFSFIGIILGKAVTRTSHCLPYSSLSINR